MDSKSSGATAPYMASLVMLPSAMARSRDGPSDADLIGVQEPGSPREAAASKESVAPASGPDRGANLLRCGINSGTRAGSAGLVGGWLTPEWQIPMHFEKIAMATLA